ncbi:MAG: isochorismatase family protein [Proteobacteria bacterium]|nr:isochorismatase family protein [Pseudomonadota bacterium]
MAEPWDEFLPDDDRAVYARTGHGARAGFGERPALMVIDVNREFLGDRPEPILRSVERWRNSCGEAGWKALPVIAGLIAACRERRVPVIYTTGAARSDGWDRGAWGWKNTRMHERWPEGEDGFAIVPEVAPAPGDIVVRKLKPSAFCGTPLLGHLMQLRVDTLIVTGASTSGCVRATVVDAFSHNLHVAVVADGCFDRYRLAHAANLFDMQAKYADLVTGDQARAYIRSLAAGLFDYSPPTPTAAG